MSGQRPAMGWGIWRCSDQIRRYLDIKEVQPDGTGAWYFTGHDKDGYPHNGYSDKQDLRLPEPLPAHLEPFMVLGQEMRHLVKTIAYQDMLTGLTRPAHNSQSEAMLQRALSHKAHAIAEEAYDILLVRLYNRSR